MRANSALDKAIEPRSEVVKRLWIQNKHKACRVFARWRSCTKRRRRYNW
jgi:hypothetical protein